MYTDPVDGAFFRSVSTLQPSFSSTCRTNRLNLSGCKQRNHLSHLPVSVGGNLRVAGASPTGLLAQLVSSQGLLGAGGPRSSQDGTGWGWGPPFPCTWGFSTGMLACPHDVASGFPQGKRSKTTRQRLRWLLRPSLGSRAPPLPLYFLVTRDWPGVSMNTRRQGS